jgi:hypothetical protein
MAANCSRQSRLFLRQTLLRTPAGEETALVSGRAGGLQRTALSKSPGLGRGVFSDRRSSPDEERLRRWSNMNDGSMSFVRLVAAGPGHRSPHEVTHQKTLEVGQDTPWRGELLSSSRY